MAGTGDEFLTAAFRHGADLDVESTISRDDYAERIVRGGFPEAVRRADPRRRGQFFGAYLSTLTDSGLCAYLLGMSAQRLATPDPAAGPLIETWVLGELGRQLDWNIPDARLYHYRTREGIEVDAVLEDSQGQIVAVEVKAGETVRSSDFRGLVHLRDRLGARFVAGFVLHLGTASRAFGDRLRALPAAALWTASP
ncbi:MAG: DUF4143 domain-containing protein [Pseudonocardiaceae bacterium]